MGSALARLLAEPIESGLSLATSLDTSDVVIDYSHPEWTAPLLERLLATPRPLLVGTTGLPSNVRDDLEALARQVPVLIAANTGTGINVLRRLVMEAVRLAGPGWDIEVLEMHHRGKVDAPSGTAWSLLEAAAGGGRDRAVAARVGETGARTDEQIGIQSLRGGDVVGEHTVFLVGHGERIELTHRAWDRDTFARGGLRAAAWLAEEGRAPGLYNMNDVLGIR
jgi:4-hydroxy-tetrahydrodipicolinate reductase